MSDKTPPATPSASASSGVQSLSAREGEILAKAWSCLKSGPPEIDYNKLAQETNMSNPRSAANAWGTIKKKMAWSTGATPAAPKSAASKSAAPKSTGKRKKTAPASADGDEDDTEDANVAAVTPTAKKAKKTPAVKTPRKKATPKSEARAKESSDEAEGEGSNADKQVKGEPGVKEEPKGDNEDEGLI